MANFAVRLVHGPNWDPGRAIRAQDGWQEHAAFMDALVDDGFIILGGPVGDGEQTLHAVEAAGEDEIRTRLARDPWASAGLLRVGPIERWAFWLDGRRLGRAGEARRLGVDGVGRAGDRRAGPAHSWHRGLRMIAVGLRDPRRAAPDAEHSERRRDGLVHLRRGGLVGALQRRGEQRVGPGGADGEVGGC
jgi:hypothetical protein